MLMLNKGLSLLVATVLMPAPALAQQAAGVVTIVDGRATMVRSALPSPTTLKFRDDVLLGDRITTGERSLVKLLMGGKALVTMREDSVLTITEDVSKVTTHLEAGKIAYRLLGQRMRPGDAHEIRTLNAIAAVRGTVLVVEVERRPAQAGGAPVPAVTTIYTFAGTVLAGAIGAPPVQLGPGQGITITGNVLGPIRWLSLADMAQALSGLESDTKLSGQPLKPDPSVVLTDVSNLTAGATLLPGPAAPGSDTGARVLPGGITSALSPPPSSPSGGILLPVPPSSSAVPGPPPPSPVPVP